MTGPLRATHSQDSAPPRGTGTTRRALLAAAIAAAITLTITGDNTMAYPTDDLTPLFVPQPPPSLSYRQGVVVEWNPDTAENVIDVDGVQVENLPMLDAAQALLLAPGDVVGILTTGTRGAAGSWMILGRVTIPGTPGTASALDSIGSVTGEQPIQHSTTSTDWTDLTGGPSITVNVRPSGRVLIIYNAQIGWAVGTGVPAGGEAGIDVSGANTLALTGTTSTDRRIRAYIESGGATTNVGIFGLGSQVMFRNLNPGATTFKLRYRSLSGHQIDFDNRAITAILL